MNLFIVTALLITGFPLGNMFGAERNHTLLKLPPAVQLAIAQEAAQADIVSIDYEADPEANDGQVIYHATIAQKGLNKRITVSSAGLIIDRSDFSKINGVIKGAQEAGQDGWEKTKEAWKETKQVAKETVSEINDSVQGNPEAAAAAVPMSFQALPLAVQTALAREAGGDAITDVFKVQKNHKEFYTATLMNAVDRKRSVTVDVSGQIVEHNHQLPE